MICVVLILLMGSQETGAATIWSGNGVYKSALIGQYWGVDQGSVAKVAIPGDIYSINDITTYSAYMTNSAELIGNTMGESFRWYNKSRLAYVKLFKVTPGQNVSFLFSDSYYVYCAQFDSNYLLVDDGKWLSTGEKYATKNTASWIMVVFRKNNGDLANGSGTDQEISTSNLASLAQKYIIFSPFTYTFFLNGGTYLTYKEEFTMERLGVEAITLPTPMKNGYQFAGWKTDNGNLYTGTLPRVYESTLFHDTSLSATWTEKKATSVTLDKTHLIMEQYAGEQYQLKATILPSDTLNKTITWSTSNSAVATVDGTGKVTGIGTGEAIITATSANGIKASCTVYVMGFQISVPAFCSLKNAYEIKIAVYHNGVSGMTDRKRVILDTEDTISLTRVGDGNTSYPVLAESSGTANGSYQALSGTSYLADTMESTSVFYRLSPKNDIKKAGDYEGSVTFTVNIR